MAAMVVRSGQFRDLNHTIRVLSNLNEQRASSRFCDVILRINNEQIFAHSNVLAAASPYFGSFLGLGQDSPRAFCQKSPQIIEIHIDSTEGDTGYGEAVRHVVDYMYTCSIELNSKIITQVIEIARIMQLHRVLEFCERFQKGETGNLPMNKSTGMPIGVPEFSLPRRLKKANAATETELSMFKKSAGLGTVSSARKTSELTDVITSDTQPQSLTEDTNTSALDQDASSTSAADSAPLPNSVDIPLPSDFETPGSTQDVLKTDNPFGITVSVGAESVGVSENKAPSLTIDSTVLAGEPVVIKQEDMLTLSVPSLTQLTETDHPADEGGNGAGQQQAAGLASGALTSAVSGTVIASGAARSAATAALAAPEVITVPLTLPEVSEAQTPERAKQRPASQRGRKPKRGRRGRKRKPREVISDSDTDMMHDLEDLVPSITDSQGQVGPVTSVSLAVSDKDMEVKSEGGDVKVSGASEADTAQDTLGSSASTTDVTSSSAGGEGEELTKEGSTQPLQTRTRGRKPITSVMASWASPRRHAGIPRSVFRSDYVMHSLVRRTRRGGGVTDSPLLSSGTHSDDEEMENLEACDAFSKNAAGAGGLGMGSTLKFVCQTCDYTTASFRLYRQHMKRHPETDNRSYTCTECNFHTTKARDLLQHRKRHLHEELICSFCEVQLDTPENFQLHLQQHAHALPYFCHSCDMRFKTRTQLSTHLPKHMTEKPFVCQVCGNGFKWKHALKNHMVTHSATKDHLCDICGFATAHKSQLKAHRLIHTGDTFKCPEPGCHFEATKRQNLKYHMVTHTQEKAHQCEVCGQAFSLIKNMRRHMLLHGDTRPYHCSQCSYTTTRFDKLKEHKLKQHGIGQPPGKKMKYGANMKDVKYAAGVKEILEIPGTVAAGLASGAITIMEDGSVVRTGVGGVEGLQIVEPITIAQDGNNITIRSDVTLTEEALQTIAQIATSSANTSADGTQPQEAHVNIGTSEGFPIFARVQFASNIDPTPTDSESDVVSYVTHVE